MRVLAACGLEGLEDDPGLNDTVDFAARLCEAPIALISIVEDHHQWFLARHGLKQRETARSMSFCGHAMLGKTATIIRDAREHPMFADNPLVTGQPHVRFYAGVPLISREGAPLGALCVIDQRPRPHGLSDLQLQGLWTLARSVMAQIESARMLDETGNELKRSEQRLRTVLNSMPDIAWSADPKGNITYTNRRWAELTGLPHGQMDFESVKQAFHPDDIEGWRTNWIAALAKTEPYEAEYRLRHADGSFRWVVARALPVFDNDGEVESWFGSITDIDAARKLSESRDLLAKELAHRIKNIFAVVGGLVTMRARGKDELKDFADSIVSTVHSLGRAQDFVHPLDSDEGGQLADLLTALMEPYQRSSGNAVGIDTSKLAIGQVAATPIALIFHELATNSTKYGALSLDDGTVQITAKRTDDDVEISWQERGGPDVTPPTSQRFGTRLIQSAAQAQLGGSIDYVSHEKGLEVALRVPLERLNA